MSKLKPFNLGQALAGKPVVTRDGTPVTEIKFFETVSEPFPIMAIVSGRYERYTKEGKWGTSSNKFNEDLFMAPEKKTYFFASWKTTCKGKPARYSTNLYESVDMLMSTDRMTGAKGTDYLIHTIEIEE